LLAVNSYNNTYITVTTPPQNAAVSLGASATYTVSRSPVISATRRTSLPRRFPTSGNPPFRFDQFISIQTPRPVLHHASLVSANDGTLFRAALATVGSAINSPPPGSPSASSKFTTVSLVGGQLLLQWSGKRSPSGSHGMSTASGSHPPTKIIRNPSLSAAQSFSVLSNNLIRFCGSAANGPTTISNFHKVHSFQAAETLLFNGHGAAVWI